MKNKTIIYNLPLFKQWRRKRLQRKWHRKYQYIFDADDLRIALTQPRYHFGEWIGAIHYAKREFNVLVEKYLYKNHPRKFKIISRFFTPKQISFLKYPNPRHQTPDLFVYKRKKFFFVEVKRDDDRLSKSQEIFFRNIEKKLKCEVIILYVRALK